jgi:hypothetical protein
VSRQTKILFNKAARMCVSRGGEKKDFALPPPLPPMGIASQRTSTHTYRERERTERRGNSRQIKRKDGRQKRWSTLVRCA